MNRAGCMAVAAGLIALAGVASAESGETARELSGHSGAVCALAWGPDGRVLVTGGADGTVRAWRPEDETPPIVCKGHKGRVMAVAVSPDGGLMVSGGEDRSVRVWSVADGSMAMILPGQVGAVNAVAFSPDGVTIAAAGAESVRFWATRNFMFLRVLKGQKDAVTALAFASEGRQLFTGGRDAAVRLVETADGALVRVFQLDEPVTAMALSPDGATLAAGGAGNTIRVWRVKDGAVVWSKKKFTAMDAEDEAVRSLAISPDGRILATEWVGSVIRLRSLTDASVVRDLKGVKGRASSLAFSPDGRALAAGTEDGTVRLWPMGDLVRPAMSAATTKEWEASRLTIAVASLTPQNLPGGDAAVVADMLRAELVKSHAFTVLERAQIEKVMAEQALQQTGCTESDCAVRLGKLLNVKRIIVGSFGKLMGSYVLTIQAVNVETGEVVFGDTVKGATVEEVQAGVRVLVVRMAKALR